MNLEGIDHVALSVRDVPRAAQWYIDVLGFEHRYADVWGDVPTFVCKGTTGIALFPPRSGSRPGAGEIRMLHLAFRADRENFLAAQRELNSKTTRFRTRYIFEIPTGTSSRSRPTRFNEIAEPTQNPPLEGIS
jgi:extradiol dioxygenase family protein